MNKVCHTLALECTPLSAKKGRFGDKTDTRSSSCVRAWFRALNRYHASIAPTSDQLINGTQPVYHVPPFTPEELAILRSLDSAND